MKKVRIFLIGLFICFFLSVSVSFSQTISVKVQNFLKVIQAATSLAEVSTAFNSAKFSQGELDQLKKAITSSSTLTQKIQQLYNQARALMKQKMDQSQQTALANLQAIRTKYVASQQQKVVATQAQIQERIKNLIATACVSDTPIITGISPAPIEPGTSFVVSGKGFGKSPGSIILNVGGFSYYCIINDWGECYVWASLTPEISGLRATNDAMLVLRTAGVLKEANMRASFQPTLEFNYNYIFRDNMNLETALKYTLLSPALTVPGLGTGGSADWSVNDFQLRNDWFVSSRNFVVNVNKDGNAHAEITYASTLNSPNDVARTDVHAGWESLSYVLWELWTYFSGPKGLAYR